MKKHVISTILVMAVLLTLTVPALAGGAAFEPVTLADDDTLKVVLTAADNGEERHADATFTMEIENKTDIALDLSLDTFAINDMMWNPIWQEGSPFSGYGNSIVVPAGETVTASARWQSGDMECLGINYAEHAEGAIATEWDYGELNEQRMAAYEAADYEAANAMEEKRAAAEKHIPISLEFPAAGTDLAPSEDIVYLTDFEPVVLVDDGSVTAVVHDYYVGIWPTLIVSVENHTDDILTCSWTPMNVDGYEVDSVGSFGFVGNTVLPGKTLVAELSISGTTIGEIVYNDTYTEVISDTTEYVEFDSADHISLPLTLTKEDGSIYLQSSVELDVAGRTDASSGIHGTAKYVDDQTMIASLPSEGPAQPAWMPDPVADADAVALVGDKKEYVIGLTRGGSDFTLRTTAVRP